MKYYIETMGCQMNERDSETISGMLEELSYKNSPRQEADILVVNTCSVRDNADKRFFGVLGQLKKIKEIKPEVVVAVCGCMMQQQHIIDEIKSKYAWVDIVFGTHNIHEFPKLLQSVISEKKKLVEVWDDGGEIVENLPSKREYKHKAYVNIMYGCNNYCTYCIVPYTRGRERSRNPAEILKEVHNLVTDGAKEIMLLGQNVNSYKGFDAKKEMNFPELIYELNKVQGLQRIRFMTSHPKDLSDELINAYDTCDKLCNSIHLPVQSGSTRILKKMNRKYTKEDYLNLIEKLRQVSPDIVITTDIITGFPGESEEDFEETMDLIRKVRFDSAFTFLYSIRKGTPAASYENQVNEEVKHLRFNRLVDELNSITLEKNKEYLGRKEKVLVESRSKTKDKMLSGRTDGGKLVNFAGDDSMVGNIIDVEITEVATFSFIGKPI